VNNINSIWNRSREKKRYTYIPQLNPRPSKGLTGREARRTTPGDGMHRRDAADESGTDVGNWEY
jgi:hypothetical protein